MRQIPGLELDPGIYTPVPAGEAQVDYSGRIDFGEGAIDATDVSKAEFMAQIGYVAAYGLLSVQDILRIPSGCMDGRTNVGTLTGQPVAPRPKVIGGNSLLGWNVASIGNFGIIEHTEDPLDQFTIVNQRLRDKGVKLGMHVICGAARGAISVIDKYGRDMHDINEFAGQEAQELLEGKNVERDIREGLERTHGNLDRVSNFTEPNMHGVLRVIEGDDAIIHLAHEDKHSTHGHEEMGMVFLRKPNVVMFKDQVVAATGRQIFYQNAGYARKIVELLAGSEEEFRRGLVIADQLPLAGVGTLGRGQHVGEIY